MGLSYIRRSGLGLTDALTVAELYKLVIINALNNDRFSSGRKGIYFGENGSYTMIDACRAYSQALYDAGKAHSPEPESFSEAELQAMGFVRRSSSFPRIHSS